MEYPEFIARFYDVIYKQVRSGTDSDFFLVKACQSKGKVLEIGVGTGRLFLEALKKGVDIYGIDISPSMIHVLHGKMDPEARNRVWVEDAVEMNVGMKFDLILAPFRVLSHVPEIEDQLKFFNGVADHLQPGGQFIFDLFVPDLSMLLEGIEKYKDFDGEYDQGKRVKRYISSHADLIRQTLRVIMTLCWEENGKELSDTWEFDMRFFFRYEIEHLIARSKLELVTIYGDYQGNELSTNSREFVVVCRKKGNSDQ